MVTGSYSVVYKHIISVLYIMFVHKYNVYMFVSEEE